MINIIKARSQTLPDGKKIVLSFGQNIMGDYIVSFMRTDIDVVPRILFESRSYGESLGEFNWFEREIMNGKLPRQIASAFFKRPVDPTTDSMRALPGYGAF